jgi:hypothetical protein
MIALVLAQTIAITGRTEPVSGRETTADPRKIAAVG